ncbi:hypothetical protein ANAPH1_00136 [Anaplasma phagocytophilum]|nr:hypothetical protein ANAPH1_00136 [Anaplasma phagocytophilum]SCV65491.1 hypothetical protein ANAPH2_01281 [Anaplasma phagocytophilum]
MCGVWALEGPLLVLVYSLRFMAFCYHMHEGGCMIDNHQFLRICAC